MLKQISIDDVNYQGSEPYSALDRERLVAERREKLFRELGVHEVDEKPRKKVMWYQLEVGQYIRTSLGRISKIKRVLEDTVLIELGNLNTGKKMDVKVKIANIERVAKTQLELLVNDDEVLMVGNQYNGLVTFVKCCKFRKKLDKIGYVYSKIGYILMQEDEIFQVRTKKAKELNVLNEYAQERRFIE